MTEELTAYKVDRPMTREQILHSAYFQCVARTADSMITGAWTDPPNYEDLIEEAIAFTDKLIEKVRERSDV